MTNVESGRIACILIIPMALIAGHIWQIPFYWTLIDCSFGFFGIIPLTICLHKIKMLERLRYHSPAQESKPASTPASSF